MNPAVPRCSALAAPAASAATESAAGQTRQRIANNNSENEKKKWRGIYLSEIHFVKVLKDQLQNK